MCKTSVLVDITVLVVITVYHFSAGFALYDLAQFQFPIAFKPCRFKCLMGIAILIFGKLKNRFRYTG